MCYSFERRSMNLIGKPPPVCRKKYYWQKSLNVYIQKSVLQKSGDLGCSFGLKTLDIKTIVAEMASEDSNAPSLSVTQCMAKAGLLSKVRSRCCFCLVVA